MNFILTGATSGIGYATMQQLLEKGHTVFAIGRDFSKINSIIQGNKGKLKAHFFDFEQINDIEKLFLEFELNNAKFDGLIHCAGVEETIPLTLYTPEKIKRIYNINVLSGIELLRHFTKKKYSNDGASVVFLSSVMGTLGQPGKIGYCSTKSAILGIVKSAALEFAKRKIRINAILPGIVNTPLTQNLFDQVGEEKKQLIIAKHPLGIGEVTDVVPAILFLLSDNSKWITGQNFVIDGGYSIE